jgi:hypothetical protein
VASRIERPTFTRDQLERELAIVEERERLKAPPAPRLEQE